MQHLNKDTFPWACLVKFAKVTYKTIDKRNIYIMIIYLSQPFSIYNWAWKPKTNLDICTVFPFNWTKQSNKLFRSSQRFVSNLFTLITIYKIVNNKSVLSNQIHLW